MKHTFSILAITTSLLTAAGVSASDMRTISKTNDIHAKANGGYESNARAEGVTPQGTLKQSESTVDLSVQNDGRINKTIETENSSDPKGLMNKTSNNTHTEVTEKANGGYMQVTTSKHKNAEGTNITMRTTTDVNIDARGNVMTTAKTEKTVDPKGLMNKTTTTNQTKAVNGKIIQQFKKVD